MNTECIDLGLISYGQAYQRQQQLVFKALENDTSYIVLCEHHPVITCGRMTQVENILVSKEDIEKKGVTIKSIDRGGDVTLHAPGQLVIYPILNLNHYGRDLHKYLHQLEEVAIALLKDFDILGQRRDGQTGVWVGAKKIASIGIGVRKWISYHGLGLNVNTDLNLFQLIKPCGLDVTMTSMAQIKGRTLDMAVIKQAALRQLADQFGLKWLNEVEY